MLASERTLYPLTAEAWLMMLSMLLWPIVVCRIADREFIWWGIATNLIAFSTWFITAYWLAAAWRRLGDDAPTLVVVLAFAAISGASAGAFVERERKKQERAALDELGPAVELEFPRRFSSESLVAQHRQA